MKCGSELHEPPPRLPACKPPKLLLHLLPRLVRYIKVFLQLSMQVWFSNALLHFGIYIALLSSAARMAEEAPILHFKIWARCVVNLQDLTAI